MQAVRQFLPGCSMADITRGLAANNGCLLEYAETVNPGGNQDGATNGPGSIIVHKIVHFHPWAVVVLLTPQQELAEQITSLEKHILCCPRELSRGRPSSC